MHQKAGVGLWVWGKYGENIKIRRRVEKNRKKDRKEECGYSCIEFKFEELGP